MLRVLPPKNKPIPIKMGLSGNPRTSEGPMSKGAATLIQRSTAAILRFSQLSGKKRAASPSTTVPSKKIPKKSPILDRVKPKLLWSLRARVDSRLYWRRSVAREKKTIINTRRTLITLQYVIGMASWEIYRLPSYFKIDIRSEVSSIATENTRKTPRYPSNYIRLAPAMRPIETPE